MPTPRLHAARLVAPLLLMTVLSACSSEEPPAVASLPPAVDTAHTDRSADDANDQGETDSAQGDKADRPVFRVDDSEERRRTIWNAYLTCLLDNGASPPPSDGMHIALGDVAVDLPGPRKAQEACQHLEPIQPPALEAATNPRFHEQSMAYVACLQRGGLWVRLLSSENLDWTYREDHPVPDDAAELEQECLVEAFGGA